MDLMTDRWIQRVGEVVSKMLAALKSSGTGAGWHKAVDIHGASEVRVGCSISLVDIKVCYMFEFESLKLCPDVRAPFLSFRRVPRHLILYRPCRSAGTLS